MHEIKRSHLYLALLVIVILESGLLYKINPFRTQPDLLLIGTLFFSFLVGYERALEIGIVAGLFRDLFSTGFFGINTVLFGIVAFLTSFYSEKIYKEFFLAQALWASVATLFLYLMYFFLRFVLFKNIYPSTIFAEGFITINVGFGEALFQVIIPVVIYTSLISPLIFFIFKKIFYVHD